MPSKWFHPSKINTIVNKYGSHTTHNTHTQKSIFTQPTRLFAKSSSLLFIRKQQQQIFFHRQFIPFSWTPIRIQAPAQTAQPIRQRTCQARHRWQNNTENNIKIKKRKERKYLFTLRLLCGIGGKVKYDEYECGYRWLACRFDWRKVLATWRLSFLFHFHFHTIGPFHFAPWILHERGKTAAPVSHGRSSMGRNDEVVVFFSLVDSKVAML